MNSVSTQGSRRLVRGFFLRAANATLAVSLLALGACSWAPPVVHEETPRLEVPSADALSNRAPQSVRDQVLLTARRMIGVDYRYGGASPATGFDCSGLVYYAHRAQGIALPRTARAQYEVARPVNRSDLRPGDLMFFRTGGKGISHVGFYLGPGRFLHAPGTGKKVSVGDYRIAYWRARFAGAGRINY